MAIDKKIYLDGIRGLLSHFEIDNLSRCYEVYKSMFHDARILKERRERK